jgi:hypothetical protein
MHARQRAAMASSVSQRWSPAQSPAADPGGSGSARPSGKAHMSRDAGDPHFETEERQAIPMQIGHCSSLCAPRPRRDPRHDYRPWPAAHSRRARGRASWLRYPRKGGSRRGRGEFTAVASARYSPVRCSCRMGGLNRVDWRGSSGGWSAQRRHFFESLMRGAVMSRGSSRGPGTTRRPSCSNIVRVSIWNQCSAAFPSTIRLISRPEKRT